MKNSLKLSTLHWLAVFVCALSLYSPWGPSGLCSTKITTRVGVGCIPSKFWCSGEMIASNPREDSSPTRAVAAVRLGSSLVHQTTTPVGKRGFVPSGTGPSRITVIPNGSGTSHLAACSIAAISDAKLVASISCVLYATNAGSLAKRVRCDAAPDCACESSFLHATLLSNSTRANRSSSVAFFRCADSFSKLAIRSRAVASLISDIFSCTSDNSLARTNASLWLNTMAPAATNVINSAHRTAAFQKSTFEVSSLPRDAKDSSSDIFPTSEKAVWSVLLLYYFGLGVFLWLTNPRKKCNTQILLDKT